MSVTLYGMHYSFWTERARWSLAHHRIEHRYREHVAMLGEWALRARAGSSEKASVPLLTDGTRSVVGSLAIMRWADEVGKGTPLQASSDAVEEWYEGLEPAMDETRRRITRAVLADQAALTEAAASAVPRFLAGLARPAAGLGARFIARKYGFDLRGPSRGDRVLEALERIRGALDGRAYLLDERFSAADILAATFLQALRPVDHPSMPIGDATRRVWTETEMAGCYSDLLKWRDQLYARHRSP
ncbi:MAG: glutathione S-transferase N-terminal domain-containing protein [Myxococcota bacterium]